MGQEPTRHSGTTTTCSLSRVFSFLPSILLHTSDKARRLRNSRARALVASACFYVCTRSTRSRVTHVSPRLVPSSASPEPSTTHLARDSAAPRRTRVSSSRSIFRAHPPIYSDRRGVSSHLTRRPSRPSFVVSEHGTYLPGASGAVHLPSRVSRRGSPGVEVRVWPKVRRAPRRGGGGLALGRTAGGGGRSPVRNGFQTGERGGDGGDALTRALRLVFTRSALLARACASA